MIQHFKNNTSNVKLIIFHDFPSISNYGHRGISVQFLFFKYFLIIFVISHHSIEKKRKLN